MILLNILFFLYLLSCSEKLSGLTEKINSFCSSLTNFILNNTNAQELIDGYSSYIEQNILIFKKNDLDSWLKSPENIDIFQYLEKISESISSKKDRLKNFLIYNDLEMENIKIVDPKNINKMLRTDIFPDSFQQNDFFPEGKFADLENIFVYHLQNYVPTKNLSNFEKLIVKFNRFKNFFDYGILFKLHTMSNGNTFSYPGMIFDQMNSDITYDTRLENFYTQSTSNKNIVIMTNIFMLLSEESNTILIEAMKRILDLLTPYDFFNIVYIRQTMKTKNNYMPLNGEHILVPATEENIKFYKKLIHFKPETNTNFFFTNLTLTFEYAFDILTNVKQMPKCSIIVLFIETCQPCTEALRYIINRNKNKQFIIFTFQLMHYNKRLKKFIKMLMASNTGQNFFINDIGNVIDSIPKIVSFLMTIDQFSSKNQFSFIYPWKNYSALLGVSSTENLPSRTKIFNLKGVPYVTTFALEMNILKKFLHYIPFPVGTYFVLTDSHKRIYYHPLMDDGLTSGVVFPYMSLDDFVNFTIINNYKNKSAKYLDIINYVQNKNFTDIRFMSLYKFSSKNINSYLYCFWYNNTMVEPVFQFDIHNLIKLLTNLNMTNLKNYNVQNINFCGSFWKNWYNTKIDHSLNKLIDQLKKVFETTKSICQKNKVIGFLYEYDLLENVTKNWLNLKDSEHISGLFVATRIGISKQILFDNNIIFLTENVYRWDFFQSLVFQLQNIYLRLVNNKTSNNFLAVVPVYYKLKNFDESLIATIGVYIKEKTFYQIFEKIINDLETTNFMIDQNGLILYDSNHELVGKFITSFPSLEIYLKELKVCQKFQDISFFTECKVKQNLSDTLFGSQAKEMDSVFYRCIQKNVTYRCSAQSSLIKYMGKLEVMFVIPIVNTNVIAVIFNLKFTRTVYDVKGDFLNDISNMLPT